MCDNEDTLVNKKQHDLVLMMTSTNERTQCPQIHDHTLEHSKSNTLLEATSEPISC